MNFRFCISAPRIDGGERNERARQESDDFPSLLLLLLVSRRTLDGNGIRCSTKRFVDVGSFHRRCRSLGRKYGRVGDRQSRFLLGEHGVFFGRGEAWRALFAEERNHFCYMLGVKSCLDTRSASTRLFLQFFIFFFFYRLRHEMKDGSSGDNLLSNILLNNINL